MRRENTKHKSGIIVLRDIKIFLNIYIKGIKTINKSFHKYQIYKPTVASIDFPKSGATYKGKWSQQGYVREFMKDLCDERNWPTNK